MRTCTKLGQIPIWLNETDKSLAIASDMYFRYSEDQLKDRKNEMKIFRRCMMNTNTKKIFAMPLLAGLTYALIWLAAGALIVSIFLQFTSMKESSLSTMAYVIHGVAALVGGLSSGKRADSKGWYYGSALGIVYGIMIIIVSFLASDISPSLHSLLLLAFVVGVGAFGGMIGVNLRKS